MRLRPAEVTKDTIAHVFGDVAFEAGHDACHGFLERRDRLAHFLRIEPFRERRGTDQIDEHDGQLPPFRLTRWRARGF
jgi:hypothetical protein